MVLTVEPGLYFDPEREAATFALREYRDADIRERRDRLGMAVASKLEREEQEQGPRRSPTLFHQSFVASAFASRTTCSSPQAVAKS